MRGNFFYSVKNLSKDENLAFTYYLYKVCLDVNEYRNYEESQTLYNALVSVLGLENHSRKVIHAFIQKHKKAKLLTPKKMHRMEFILLIFVGIFRLIIKKTKQFMIDAVNGIQKH